MKIRRFLSVFLLTLLLTGLFCVPQASAVDLPQVNAKAALLMDYESGRMLYGLNERDTEYPASITKVMHRRDERRRGRRCHHRRCQAAER